MAGIRKIDRGRDQYSEGTTIDGNRLDRTMDALVSRMGEIPKGDFRRRFTQGQIVSGLIPVLTSLSSSATYARLPFLDETNDQPQYYDTVADKSPKNLHRLKGIHDPEVPTVSSAQLKIAWTAAQYIKDPVVISQLDAMMICDTVYPNTWKYGSDAPGGKVNGDYIDDVHVHLTVDGPWNPEDRSAGAVEVHRYRFKASAEFFNLGSLSVTSSYDMVPNHSQSIALSLHVNVRDINIPIHRDSRLRWSVAIPWGGYAPWGTNPVHTGVHTMVLTYLEEIKAGA